MKPTRHLSLAALACLLAFPALAETGKVGEQAFTYRETIAHDTLWDISRTLMPGKTDVTQQQIMAALLRQNPDAFLNGSVFYLRKGVTLTVPTIADIKAEDALKAESFYAGQEKAWLAGETGNPPLYPLSKGVQTATTGTAPAPSAAAPAPVEAPVATAPSTPPTPAPEPKPEAKPEARAGLSDAPITTGNDVWKGYWPYLAGLMLVILGWWAMSRKGKTAPAAPVAATSTKGVAVSMEGLEKTRAVEAMAVAQTLVTTSQPAPAHAPVESHEAAIKLKMAKAYLELKRDKAARELLEEVILEGEPHLQEQARQLLAA